MPKIARANLHTKIHVLQCKEEWLVTSSSKTDMKSWVTTWLCHRFPLYPWSIHLLSLFPVLQLREGCNNTLLMVLYLEGVQMEDLTFSVFVYS